MMIVKVLLFFFFKKSIGQMTVQIQNIVMNSLVNGTEN